jgi:hypothetical protein
MKPLMLLRCVALLTMLGTAGVVAHEQPGSAESLGQVHFPVSCNAAAQAQFDRAMARLHSFWFAPAIKTFNAVMELDPSCAMGRWGVAMSLLGNPFAWPPSSKALTDGWTAVEQATAVGAKTPRERAYIAAIAAFYKDAGTVEHRTRALAYEQGLEQLVRQYPDDREATIFYALALNATALPTARRAANTL